MEQKLKELGYEKPIYKTRGTLRGHEIWEYDINGKSMWFIQNGDNVESFDDRAKAFQWAADNRVKN